LVAKKNKDMKIMKIPSRHSSRQCASQITVIFILLAMPSQPTTPRLGRNAKKRVRGTAERNMQLRRFPHLLFSCGSP
jgi:hypothetical protein